MSDERKAVWSSSEGFSQNTSRGGLESVKAERFEEKETDLSTIEDEDVDLYEVAEHNIKADVHEDDEQKQDAGSDSMDQSGRGGKRKPGISADLPFGKKAHPAAKVFPRISDEEMELLADNIKANGLREPIALCEGLVLDGINRLIACEKAGKEPRYKEFKGGNPWEYTKSANEHRRHMTQSQRAIAMKRWAEGKKEWEEEQARAQETANRSRSESAIRQKRGGSGQFEHDDGSPAAVPATGGSHEAPSHTRNRLAKEAKVSARMMQHAITVDATDNELGDRVLAGTISLPEAAKKVRHAKKVATLSTEGCGKLAGKAKGILVLLASDADQGEGSAKSRQYLRTRISVVADPNGSTLFLFLNPTNLLSGLRVLKAGDFEFRTIVPWFKAGKTTTGSNIAKCEMCLVGTRGAPKFDPASLPGLVVAKAGKDNTIPDALYEMVERAVKGTKVEIGGSGQARDGWDVLPGDDAPPAGSKPEPAKKRGSKKPEAKKPTNRKSHRSSKSKQVRATASEVSNENESGTPTAETTAVAPLPTTDGEAAKHSETDTAGIPQMVRDSIDGARRFLDYHRTQQGADTAAAVAMLEDPAFLDLLTSVRGNPKEPVGMRFLQGPVVAAMSFTVAFSAGQIVIHLAAGS